MVPGRKRLTRTKPWSWKRSRSNPLRLPDRLKGRCPSESMGIVPSVSKGVVRVVAVTLLLPDDVQKLSGFLSCGNTRSRHRIVISKQSPWSTRSPWLPKQTHQHMLNRYGSLSYVHRFALPETHSPINTMRTSITFVCVSPVRRSPPTASKNGYVLCWRRCSAGSSFFALALAYNSAFR